MSDQPPVPPTQPTPPSPPPGGATWQGVQPVVERPDEPPTTAMAPTPPPPPVPPVPGPPVGPGPASGSGGGGNGKTIAIVLVIVAILGVGGFLLLSGGDDDGDDDVATQQDDEDDEDEDEDEETTTTEAEEEETTTTTVEPEETTTSAAADTTVPVEGGELTFTGITDDTGRLVVEVPDTWTQVDGTSLGDGAPNVQASTDLAGFRQLTASGLSFTLLNQQNADPDATLDFLTSSHVDGCEEQPRQDYTDGVFTGRLQQLDNCGGQGVTLITIVASNAAGQSVEVSTVIVPPDPLEEIERHIIETFNVNA